MARSNGVVDVLNQIVEHELAGAVRYTQYSLMIFGHARIPIIGWMQKQAMEALAHATQAGEEVTTQGGKVSLGIGKLVGLHHAHVDEILGELLVHERTCSSSSAAITSRSRSTHAR